MTKTAKRLGQKITPFLWFTDQAEPAARFYTSIFKNSRITTVTRYDQAAAKASGRRPGSIMTVEFRLAGQKFVALNGGPHFKFNEAISFVVSCRNQAELDYYWKKLSAGGKEVQCGWLRDRYGVSWQVVPQNLDELLRSRSPQASRRVMEALLKMVKLDIQTLKRAARGERQEDNSEGHRRLMGGG